jgi:hypothetical protein
MHRSSPLGRPIRDDPAAPLKVRALIASLVAAAILASVAPAVAAAQTVRGAARATERCLDAHGWNAWRADSGHTTNARPPRGRPGWYSVAFYRSGKVIRWNAYRQALTYRDGKLAGACTRAAAR